MQGWQLLRDLSGKPALARSADAAHQNHHRVRHCPGVRRVAKQAGNGGSAARVCRGRRQGPYLCADQRAVAEVIGQAWQTGVVSGYIQIAVEKAEAQGSMTANVEVNLKELNGYAGSF